MRHRIKMAAIPLVIALILTAMTAVFAGAAFAGEQPYQHGQTSGTHDGIGSGGDYQHLEHKYGR